MIIRISQEDKDFINEVCGDYADDVLQLIRYYMKLARLKGTDLQEEL